MTGLFTRLHATVHEFDHQTKWSSRGPPPAVPSLSASLGTLVALVAFTAPLATVNQTVAGLGAGASGRTWILSSMSIGLGAFLLTAGRVADDFGRRRTFVVGALRAGGRSRWSAAVAPDVVVFVLARVVQGIGGAAVIAASLGMIAATFPDPHERAHATGIWGASVGAGHRGRPAALRRAGAGRLLARRVRRAGRGRCRARAHRARLPRVARRRTAPGSTCRVWSCWRWAWAPCWPG